MVKEKWSADPSAAGAAWLWGDLSPGVRVTMSLSKAKLGQNTLCHGGGAPLSKSLFCAEQIS